MFSDEIIKLSEDVLEHARKNNLQVVTAESCTGGLIIGVLTEIAGSSDVVDRGYITYSNLAKQQELGVNPETLENHGAVSEETALEMVSGALNNSGCDIAVAVTGIAGPGGGTDTKPVGLVHIAVQKKEKPPIHKKCLFGDIGRDKVREATVIAALELLNKTI
ncbi:CinA family protein [Pseudemcibacter aquimaris]|uniref:CinA family protein n=1 Tax=Pseudemcibacter aquimaris TaxID=2857064 RepID=UPI002013A018|nr:CinA family protein [Pseudemcibacter aquimaris]MCC3860925.1 CinA family protein [Pseudemcibacter aquimaris]WDU59744.1 CinA family protein [Pseudemcibacter aquimaris]